MSIVSNFIANLPRLPKRDERDARPSASPIKLVRSLSWLQQAFFWCAWLAWTCDAIDFFAVSLSITRLIDAYGKTQSDITTSITLTLLFRPLGALVFGLLTERYGRKWPFVANLLGCAVLSLATGFCKSFGPFLAVRCLFGVLMGGIWGQSAALGLENMPRDARGLYSGILQQGYAVGYLCSAVVNLTAVAQRDDWRVLFYIAAGISLFAALVRLALPESTYFQERVDAARASGETQMSSSDKTKTMFKEAGRAVKLHWARCIWAICFMTGMNFFSHGSQDLYPRILEGSKGQSAHNATIATIIGNCGAIAGGVIAGWASQYLGRRLTIIICCVWTCAFIPLWLLPNNFSGLAAGAFMVQMGVQGAWSTVPIYLSEISPVAFRSVFPGLAYQLGNMVSSASAQIETTGGNNIRTSTGEPDYAVVSAILIAVVAAWIIGCCLVGSEQHGASFEKGKAAFERGGGNDELDIHDRLHEGSPDYRADEEKGSPQREKAAIEHNEKA